MLFCLPLGPAECALHFSGLAQILITPGKTSRVHVKRCNLIPRLKIVCGRLNILHNLAKAMLLPKKSHINRRRPSRRRKETACARLTPINIRGEVNIICSLQWEELWVIKGDKRTCRVVLSQLFSIWL